MGKDSIPHGQLRGKPSIAREIFVAERTVWEEKMEGRRPRRTRMKRGRSLERGKCPVSRGLKGGGVRGQRDASREE